MTFALAVPSRPGAIGDGNHRVATSMQAVYHAIGLFIAASDRSKRVRVLATGLPLAVQTSRTESPSRTKPGFATDAYIENVLPSSRATVRSTRGSRVPVVGSIVIIAQRGAG